MAWEPTKPAENELLDNVSDVVTANWAALSTTIGVDHNIMDATNDGKHKQVTLPILAVKPAASGTAGTGYVYTKDWVGATTQPELFFETQAGSEVQLTKYAALNLFSAITQSANGTITFNFVNDLVFKWGSDTITSGNTKAVTFATTFLHEVYQIIVSQKTTSHTIILSSTSPVLTGFTCKSSSSVPGSLTFSYIAIGY